MGASACRRVSRDMTQLRQLGGVTTPRAEQKQKTRYKDGLFTHSVDNRWTDESSEQKTPRPQAIRPWNLGVIFNPRHSP